MGKPCLLFTDSELPVLDVRKLHSYQKQHLKNSAHIQANELIQRHNEMPARPAWLNLIATDQKERLEVSQWLASKGYHISEVKIEAELLEFIAANPQHLAKGTSQKTLWTPCSLRRHLTTD